MINLAWDNCDPNMSVTDLSYAILKAHGAPLYFGELFEKVMTIKPLPGRDKAHIMAGIHTELNLDGRFNHVGKGTWGLREWMPDRRITLNRDSEEDWDH